MNIGVSGRSLADRGAGVERCAAPVASFGAGAFDVEPGAGWAAAAESGAGASTSKAGVLRAALVAGLLVAVLVAGLVSGGAAQAAEPELTRLLRGMAVIKGMLASAAAGLVWWRFGRPVSARAAAAYIACTSVLFASTVLIWQLAFILAAAGLFHAGALVGAVVAIREGRPMSRFERRSPRQTIERAAQGRSARS